jgi:hypothetical protein
MKRLSIVLFLLASVNHLFSQGCSDAGFCTIGDFNSQHKSAESVTFHKNEIDISFTYATHGKNEKFYQPQINYRLIKRNKSFFEFRLPLNSAKNTSSGISNTGVGDVMATYNNSISASKNKIDYSVGFRVSLTNAGQKASNASQSYPMYLQPGLGTTDLLAVANYTFVKYISIGTGIQLPLLQYNKNKILFYPASGVIAAEGYRRKPDALLRLTGHYQAGKFKANGTVLGIFHLADDYYKTMAGKYSLTGSKGTTLNYVFDFSYAAGSKLSFGLLYASPFKTRKNIPDGLARSSVISLKLTLAF